MRASTNHKHQTNFRLTMKRDEYAIREANTVFQQDNIDGLESKKLIAIFAVVIVIGIFYAAC